jgi:hypothetical protein
MRRTFALCVLLAASTVAAVAGEWHGYLMDAMCAAKMKDKAAGHKAKCALSCAKTGYGIVTADGQYVKFDEAGNAKAQEALKATSKEQDLKVKVTGTKEADMILVESVTIN